MTTVTAYPEPGLTIPLHSEWTRNHYPLRIASFRKTPVQPGDVVMLGDSLTEMGGDWEARLAKPNIKNRGISGDVSAGVLARIGECLLYRPRAVLLMIGVNDLLFCAADERDETCQQLVSNIKQIAEGFAKYSGDTQLVVQCLLPTADPGLRPFIQTVNEQLRRLCHQGTASYAEIDEAFKDENGLLKSELTTDGVHLTDAGYQLWAAQLKAMALPF